MNKILKPKIEKIESEIIEKLAIIENDLQSIDKDTGASLHKQFELSGTGIIPEFYSNPDPIAKSFWGEVGLFGSSAGAVGAWFFTGIGLLPIVLAASGVIRLYRQ